MTTPHPNPAPPPPAETAEGLPPRATTPVAVTLRAGGSIDGRIAGAVLTELECLREQSPDLFAAVLGLARGEDAPPAAAEQLREGLLLVGADGRLRPGVREVVLSAVLDTPEGTVLRNPLEPTEANRAVYLTQQARYERNQRREYDRLTRPPDDDGQGSGPSR